MHKSVSAAAIATLLGIAAPGHADVIAGTGVEPSQTTLGMTDATRFDLRESGTGHALIFPYFNAQRGNMTVVHLTNTDPKNGKVVKVRFRGAGNADTLLDLLVVLAARDVWTAAITTDGNGLAQLTTADGTCTYPRLQPGVPQPFSVARLNPSWPVDTLRNNTREGYAEAIVAADIPVRYFRNGSEYLSPLSRTISPQGAAAACDPQVMNPVLTTAMTDETTAAGLGLATPTGGLLGSWYLINVAETTTFSGRASALRAVNAEGKNARGNLVLFPQTDGVVTAPERYTSDPLLVSAGLALRAPAASSTPSAPTTTAVLVARYSDLPDLSTPYYLPAGEENARTTAGHLNALLATESVTNEFARDEEIAAQTDWLFTFPTKRYSAAVDYAEPAAPRVFSVVPPTGPQHFHTANTTLNAQSQMCFEQAPWQMSDRFGVTATSSGPVGPAPTVPRPCGAAHVMAFAVGNSALSASVARTTNDFNSLKHGWMVLTMPNPGLGVPVLGAAFLKLSNPQASPGVSGTYGIQWPHNVSR